MEYKDYYKTLGVNRSASEKEIRDAFRRLARKYHPDINPGDSTAEAKFKEINEAYQVLSDPEKRKKYDELGPRWDEFQRWERAGGEATGRPFDWGAYQRGTQGGGTHYEYYTTTPEDFTSPFEGGIFSDFFQTFFGPDAGLGGRRSGFRPRRGPRKGEDIEQLVEITLEEAYNGTQRVVEFTDEKGQTHRFEVTIPPGVGEGSRVRVAGKGAPGIAGGPPGDLYLQIRELPHPRFERRNSDVYVKVPVPLDKAILGGEVTVPTPAGTRLALKIPPETQNNQTFRLRGQGMPHVDNPQRKGDLFAQVQVVLPTRLSPEERRLFERLAELHRHGKAAA